MWENVAAGGWLRTIQQRLSVRYSPSANGDRTTCSLVFYKLKRVSMISSCTLFIHMHRYCTVRVNVGICDLYNS